jgi:hypothetical protein
MLQATSIKRRNANRTESASALERQDAFEGEKGDEKLRSLSSVLVQEMPEGGSCQEQHRG